MKLIDGNSKTVAEVAGIDRASRLVRILQKACCIWNQKLTAVMLRNVLERRREMALLRAAGYRGSDLATLVVAENAVLLFGGLLCGVASAVLAILPALVARGAMPGGGIGIILGGVVLVGLSASIVAVVALLRMPLLASLRSE